MEKEEKVERFNRLVKYYKSLPKNQKRLATIGLALGFLMCCFILGCFAGYFLWSLAAIGNKQKGGILYYGFVYSNGRTITLILILIFAIIIAIFLISIDRQNKVVVTDERGVRYLKNGTNGTSRWMDKDDAEKVFEITNIKNTNTTIYGQFTEHGEEVCGFIWPKDGASGNKNNLIIGPPGTGKSFTFVRTELIQSVLRGESIVCTDPSGELYADISTFARNHGYDTKILNLSDPNISDCWDCLQEVINPETERIDSTRLNAFASIYMKNSSDTEGKSEQKFWYDGALNLITTVIGFVSYEREKEIVDRLTELYKKVNSINPSEKMQYILLRIDKMSFPNIKAVIYEDAKRNGYDLKEVQNIIEDIFKSAPEFNIGKVFDYLKRFDAIEDKLDILPDWHPASTAYSIYKQNASKEDVKNSIIQGAKMRMQIFADEKVRAITSHKGIDLSNVNAKKTAYFVIMPDTGADNLKPIASLFFSFLFLDAQKAYDKAQIIAKANGEKNPKLPINIVLDEFFSIGVIGGSPKSFATTMSNSRKRQLYISIIVQSFPSQVEELYGMNNTKTILNGCDTLLVLGCKDDSTAAWVSRYIGGSATVQSESHKENGGIINKSGTSINAGSTSRPLLTMDEARTWRGKILCVRQDRDPLSLKPFPWIDHPAVKNNELETVSIYDGHIRRISDLIDDEIMNYEVNKTQTDIHNAIVGLESDITVVVNDETGEVTINKNDKKGSNKKSNKKKFEQTRLQEIEKDEPKKEVKEVQNERQQDSLINEELSVEEKHIQQEQVPSHLKINPETVQDNETSEEENTSDEYVEF